MSEVKFTKGPWKAVDNGVYWDVLEEAPGYRGGVCSVHDGENIKGITCAEQVANAHLIAAAPDLYEALERAIISMKESAVDMHYNHYGEVMSYDELKEQNKHPDYIDIAESTLAKARGETPETSK